MSDNSNDGDHQHQQHQHQRDNEQDNRGDPVELASKSILIQNKRFYLDVKENDRGRFLKIAEVTPGGHKNRVTMAMKLLPEFRDKMSDFIDHYANLGPSNITDESNDDNTNRRPLKTSRIVAGPRRYFLDLKENVRGRYLRVRAPGQNRDNKDQQVIVIPASGMIEFRDTVSKVIDEFVVEPYKEENYNVYEEDLPKSSTIGSRRTKVFYMDVASNNRGIYCRMTEQSNNFRQSLTVPDKYFREMGEWFIKAADQLEQKGDTISSPNSTKEDRNKGSRKGRGARKDDKNGRRRSRDDDEYDDE